MRSTLKTIVALQGVYVLSFVFGGHREYEVSPSNDESTAVLPVELQMSTRQSREGASVSTPRSPILQQQYSTALEQSFGFFDDIGEDQWKQAQQIKSNTFPNFYRPHLRQYSNSPNDKGNVNKLKMSNWWNGENFQVEFHCPLAQRLPSDSQADGPKWVCDPHRLKSKPQQDVNVPPCLVYSVGSNGKAEFEKGVRDTVGNHCEIHTFDMVSHNKRNGHFDKALEGYATFHNWGLGTEEEAANSKRFKTLEQTMIELGHVNRTIDIFKIDCEWCEWFTFRQWLSQDIRQILVETHNAPMPHAQDFFFDLHDAGYAIFSKEANYQNSGGGVEFGFLKLAKEFFGGKFYQDLAMSQ